MDSTEQELARRRIYQAMIEQGMAPDQQQVVSGRVVPYHPIQGLSKLAQAYLGRKGLDKMEATKLDEGNQSAQAYQDALTTMQGIPGQAEGSQDAGVNQLVGDNRVSSSKREAIIQAMIEKKMGLNTSGNQYYSTDVDDQGRMWQIPGRGGNAVPVMGADGKQMVRGSSSVDLQGQLAASKEQAKQQALIAAAAEKAKQEKLGAGAGVEATSNILASAAGDEAAAVAAGKVRGETGAKASISADKFDGYYDQTMSLLSQDPTESGLGSAFDAAGAFVSYSPKGAAVQDSLKVMAANLTGLVPRFEGPQSDKDTALYKEAAAQVGANIPVDRRMAALKTMKEVMDRNKADNTFKGFGSEKSDAAEKKEVSRKVKNGITIIKYSDGTYGQE